MTFQMTNEREDKKYEKSPGIIVVGVVIRYAILLLTVSLI